MYNFTFLQFTLLFLQQNLQMEQALAISFNIMLDKKLSYCIQVQIPKTHSLTLQKIVTHILSIVTNRSEQELIKNQKIYLDHECVNVIDMNQKPVKDMTFYFDIEKQLFQSWTKQQKLDKKQGKKENNNSKSLQNTSQSKQMANSFGNQQKQDQKSTFKNDKASKQEVNLQKISENNNQAKISQSYAHSNGRVDVNVNASHLLQDNHINQKNGQNRNLLGDQYKNVKQQSVKNNNNSLNNTNEVSKAQVAQKEDCCVLI